jgi:nucleotide sugar dehydrogenase
MNDDATIAVVGLGYVGLPLAVEFGKKFRTVGFDLSAAKIEAYRRYVDPTREVSTEELRAATRLSVTDDPAQLGLADFIVVAVPTPIDEAHQPDFGPLLGASESVGRNLKRGATVVFESTVYPGATEEICIPVIERHSGMQWRRDFFVGYSPERINPGDREHFADAHHQGRIRRFARNARAGRRDLRQHHHRRRAPGEQHQGCRSGKGHREHAARSHNIALMNEPR